MNSRALYSMLAGALLTIFVSSAAFGNPYEVLGLDGESTSPEDIRAAYIRLIRIYHEGGSEPDPQKYKEINVAYQALQASSGGSRKAMSPADQFRALVQARVEGSEKIRARHGAMAQYFAMFYDGTGMFIDARILLMSLNIEPSPLLVYDMEKELRKTSDSIAGQIQFAKGNFGQREFSRNFYQEDLVSAILSLMMSFTNDLETVSGTSEWPDADFAELKRELRASVGAMFTNLGFGCNANMKSCLLNLLEGIESREMLYGLLDANNTKILLGLIDDVVRAESRSWIFQREYWRFQNFRRKLIGLHSGKILIHIQTCEALFKDSLRKLGR